MSDRKINEYLAQSFGFTREQRWGVVLLTTGVGPIREKDWDPISDINHALIVEKEMRAKGELLILWSLPGGGFSAMFNPEGEAGPDRPAPSVGYTIEVAICRAAVASLRKRAGE